MIDLSKRFPVGKNFTQGFLKKLWFKKGTFSRKTILRLSR
jgi:hypothetical protein